MTGKELLIKLLESKGFKTLNNYTYENEDFILMISDFEKEKKIKEILSFNGYVYKIRKTEDTLQVIIKVKR